MKNIKEIIYMTKEGTTLNKIIRECNTSLKHIEILNPDMNLVKDLEVELPLLRLTIIENSIDYLDEFLNFLKENNIERSKDIKEIEKKLSLNDKDNNYNYVVIERNTRFSEDNGLEEDEKKRNIQLEISGDIVKILNISYPAKDEIDEFFKSHFNVILIDMKKKRVVNTDEIIKKWDKNRKNILMKAENMIFIKAAIKANSSYTNEDVLSETIMNNELVIILMMSLLEKKENPYIFQNKYYIKNGQFKINNVEKTSNLDSTRINTKFTGELDSKSLVGYSKLLKEKLLLLENKPFFIRSQLEMNVDRFKDKIKSIELKTSIDIMKSKLTTERGDAYYKFTNTMIISEDREN